MKKRRKRADKTAAIPIQEMLDLLPRGCLGEFDFISGLLYVDCTEAEHKALVDKRETLGSNWDAELSERDRLIVETSLHEYFHYLQVLSSGYLFEIVITLLEALTATLNRLQQDETDTARLASFGRLAERILRALGDRSERSALAPIDIIEGAAYYFQSRSLGQAPDHDGMLKALERPGLEAEYKRAYEYTTAKLQGDAFPLFLACAATALLFADPVAAFEDLLDQVAAAHLSGEDATLGDMLALLYQRHPHIGGAIEIWTLWGKQVYPWYGVPLSTIAASGAAPPAFFGLTDDDLVKHLPSPMVFRDSFRGDLGIQAMFALMASRSSLRFTLPYKRSA